MRNSVRTNLDPCSGYGKLMCRHTFSRGARVSVWRPEVNFRSQEGELLSLNLAHGHRPPRRQEMKALKEAKDAPIVAVCCCLLLPAAACCTGNPPQHPWRDTIPVFYTTGNK
uniref:Uncharacterized protein n=1 Tax=Mus spicilegus TaxID=10103 RepID=A0A8C6IDH6_MUSSI